MTSEIYDFILGLRALRSYTDEPLRDEDLDAVLEAGVQPLDPPLHQQRRLPIAGDAKEDVRDHVFALILARLGPERRRAQIGIQVRQFDRDI